MNEDLQKALAEFVKATLAGLQQGKDFVVGQAPEVIQQLIRWHFWLNTGQALLAIALLVTACVVVPGRLQRIIDTNAEDGQFVRNLLITIVLGVSGLCSFCILLPPDSTLGTALEIYLAPKVWLLEWAMSQLHK